MTSKEIKAIKSELLPEAQHHRVDVIQGERDGYDVRATVQIPLDYYHKQNWITDKQWRAGDRLFKDYRHAGIFAPRGMELVEYTDKCGRQSDGLKQQEAIERVREAQKAISGAIGKLMVLNVCCYGMALKGLEFDHYSNSNQKMARFREAMDDLVSFYDSI